MGDRPLIDHCAQLRAGGVHQRRFRGHFDYFLGAAGLQSRIQRDHLVDFDGHILLHILLEAALLKLGRVIAGDHLQKIVVAAGVGLGIAGDAGCLVGQRDFHVGQYRTGRVGHATQDSATRALGKDKRGT